MKLFGETNREVKYFFPWHQTQQTCLRSNQSLAARQFSDKSGIIVLITIVINSLMLSLCNIYTPHNQASWTTGIQLQELDNCLIDKSELTTLIVGGDWYCTLSKNDKIGGKPFKTINFSIISELNKEFPAIWLVEWFLIWRYINRCRRFI